MATVATAMRKFIVGVTRIFHGAKTAFDIIVSRWRSTIFTLGKKVRSLANHFGSLKLSRRLNNSGGEVIMLGQMESREFTRLLRVGRSVDAFERATGTIMSPVARNAFRHLDEVANLNFPNMSLLKRVEYTTRMRETLITKGIISRIDRISNAETLEKLIRSDAETLKRTNLLLPKVFKTRKILFLGTAIAVTSAVSISMLCRTLAKYAIEHSGCFMYTRDLTNGVRRCRIAGCSCPPHLSSNEDHGDIRAMALCDERNLWDKMHIRNNECSIGVDVGRTAPFCVHCDWDETDSSSIDFVDRDKLQENAYVKCENIDSLDALNETIGSMVDGAFNVGESIANSAKESLTSIANAIPWIFGGLAIFIILIAFVFVWRISNGLLNSNNNTNNFENTRYPNTVVVNDSRGDKIHHLE